MFIGFINLPNLSLYCGCMGILVAQEVHKYLAVQTRTYVINNRIRLVSQLMTQGLDSATANRTVAALVSGSLLHNQNRNQCAIYVAPKQNEKSKNNSKNKVA
jgi:hypothetical protein